MGRSIYRFDPQRNRRIAYYARAKRIIVLRGWSSFLVIYCGLMFVMLLAIPYALTIMLSEGWAFLLWLCVFFPCETLIWWKLCSIFLRRSRRTLLEDRLCQRIALLEQGDPNAQLSGLPRPSAQELEDAREELELKLPDKSKHSLPR